MVSYANKRNTLIYKENKRFPTHQENKQLLKNKTININEKTVKRIHVPNISYK